MATFEGTGTYSYGLRMLASLSDIRQLSPTASSVGVHTTTFRPRGYRGSGGISILRGDREEEREDSNGESRVGACRPGRLLGTRRACRQQAQRAMGNWSRFNLGLCLNPSNSMGGGGSGRATGTTVRKGQEPKCWAQTIKLPLTRLSSRGIFNPVVAAPSPRFVPPENVFIPFGSLSLAADGTPVPLSCPPIPRPSDPY